MMNLLDKYQGINGGILETKILEESLKDPLQESLNELQEKSLTELLEKCLKIS